MASLTRLELLMDCADFDGVAQAAQRLTANSVVYGLPNVARIGKALETAASCGDVLAMVKRIDDLRDYLAHGEHESPAAA